MRHGIAYGWLSARRRLAEMLLPAITTATGAFLTVIVFGMATGIQAQARPLGHAEEIGHAVVLIAVTVLLVGVVEVAVATTRTIAHRTRELGVLGANGVRRGPVLIALLVEPALSATAGAVAGALLAAVAGGILDITGIAQTGLDAAGTATGALLAVVVSVVAAVLASLLPTWRAVSRPPIRSLTN